MGLKAWGEAQRASPQGKVRKENPLSPARAKPTVELMPVFCFGILEADTLAAHPVRNIHHDLANKRGTVALTGLVIALPFSPGLQPGLSHGRPSALLH